MPYAKGESGNPAGRKAGSRNKATAEVKEYAQRFTVEAIDCLVTILRDETAPPQARVLASRELLDRGHGRAAQSIDVAQKGVTVNLGFISNMPPAPLDPKVLPSVNSVVQVMRPPAPVLIASTRESKD